MASPRNKAHPHRPVFHAFPTQMWETCFSASNSTLLFRRCCISPPDCLPSPVENTRPPSKNPAQQAFDAEPLALQSSRAEIHIVSTVFPQRRLTCVFHIHCFFKPDKACT